MLQDLMHVLGGLEYLVQHVSFKSGHRCASLPLFRNKARERVDVPKAIKTRGPEAREGKSGAIV